MTLEASRPAIVAVVPYRASKARVAGYDKVVAHLHAVADEVIVTDDGGDTFSRGASINQGVEWAAEMSLDAVVVACDADLIVPHDQLLDAVKIARFAGQVVLPFDRYHYLTGDASRRVVAGAPLDRGAPATFTMDTSVGGTFVCTVDTFDQVGGFDPRFRGWGGEDYAFHAAADTLVGVCRVRGPLFHLWHPVEEHRPEENFELMGRYVAAKGSLEDIRRIQAEVAA